MKQKMIAEFHKTLMQWYRANGRHELPWRTTDDPYAIYISEVMLQQTQVKTVLARYYFPFLQRFPTLTALAKADQETVLSHWQGLGYYNRAINLHKAAKQTAPALPDNVDGLIALPGIGKNTAHAILAFAFHQPVAILEANVKRIIYRIFALETANDKELWNCAYQLLNQDAPFDYNQSMMDLGAMICTPKAPKCDLCPAASICKGKDTPFAYPKPKAKKQTPIRQKTILVLQDANERYYMTPRNSRFLNGLYGFIEMERHDASYAFSGQNIDLKHTTKIGHITQTYSHFRLDAGVHLHQIDHSFNSPDWFDLATLQALPMSRADEKILKLL